MRQLQITPLATQSQDLNEVSKALDTIEVAQSVDIVNWSDYPYQPDVTFRMAYREDALFLKFYVSEKAVRAVNGEPNGSVWEDSCCEFFCDFDGKGYYNLETNCIGTQLLGWGGEKATRERASAATINSIIKLSTLGAEPFDVKEGEFKYEIVMAIPATAFYAHTLTFKKGMTFRANFYKCGDKTPDMHFLSWSPIDVNKPNFHLPQFFGKIELI